MEFKFECNDEKEVTLEVEGNIELIIDAMASFGGLIRTLANNVETPISYILLPLIMESSAIEDKELDESAKDLLVEMQKDLSEFSEKKEEPKLYNAKVVCVKAVNTFFTKGKIYDVVNGVLKSNFNGIQAESYKSLEDLNNGDAVFIEVVE